MKKYDFRGAVLPVVLLVLWYAVTALHWIDAALLPAPSAVWAELVQAVQKGELYENVLSSLLRNTSGFLIGGGLGALAGLALGLNHWADRIFAPTLNAVKHVAVFAWIPLMIMWFGNGEVSKVILPAAAPNIFAGLNIALVFSWVATVGAEYFFVAAPGVVNPILDGQNLFQMEVVIYGMVIIGAVGLVFSKAAQYFENYNLRWRQGTHK